VHQSIGDDGPAAVCPENWIAAKIESTHFFLRQARNLPIPVGIPTLLLDPSEHRWFILPNELFNQLVGAVRPDCEES
jgi:hypothetical protein